MHGKKKKKRNKIILQTLILLPIAYEKIYTMLNLCLSTRVSWQKPHLKSEVLPLFFEREESFL